MTLCVIALGGSKNATVSISCEHAKDESLLFGEQFGSFRVDMVYTPPNEQNKVVKKLTASRLSDAIDWEVNQSLKRFTFYQLEKKRVHEDINTGKSVNMFALTRNIEQEKWYASQMDFYSNRIAFLQNLQVQVLRLDPTDLVWHINNK